MSFQDDSHILSRLGILDSVEPSPRRVEVSPAHVIKKCKTPENDAFVEVNITGDIDSETDDNDDVFDKDRLLSPSTRSKVKRIHPESYLCRYFLLMLSYFSLGMLCLSTTRLISRQSKDSSHSMYFVQSLGLFLGVLIGRTLIFRISSFLIFLGNFVLATAIFGLLITSPLNINLHMITCIQAAVEGIIIYSGLALYFSLWRTHNRKILWFYTLLALGTVVILFFTHPVNLSLDESKTVQKRQAPDEMNGYETDNLTEIKSKKPEVAQGQSNVNTKTEENKLMREKFKTSNLTEIVPKNLPQNSSVKMTVRLSSVVTTTMTPHKITTEAFVFPTERSSRGKDRFRMSEPNNSTEVFLFVVLGFTAMLHVFGFCCCCIHCRFGPDPKIIKLCDPNFQSFSKGLRLRLIIFYVICGFTENILLMYLDNTIENRISWYPQASFIVRFLAIIPGTSAYSLPVIYVTAFTGLFSSFFVAFNITIDLNLAILCGVCGYLPLCVFLNIESRLSPRPSILLDYFFISHSAGYFIASTLCWYRGNTWYLENIVAALIFMTMVLILLMRAVAKAVRMKEIMEYTSRTPGTLEEYLALVDREQLTFSDIDEQDESIEL